MTTNVNIGDASHPSLPQDPDTSDEFSVGTVRPIGDVLARLVLEPLSGASGAVLQEIERRAGELVAGDILDAIVAADRLLGWVTAVQQRLLARFARPGVAVPIAAVLSAAVDPASSELLRADHPVQPAIDDLIDPERCWTETTVYGDPEWDQFVAEHAARMAAPELSAALMISPFTAGDRVDRAREMVDELPDVIDAVQAGSVDPFRARILADSTRGLALELRRAVAAQLLPRARSLTPGRLRAAISRTAIALDPAAARDRADQAHRERGIGVRSLGDDLSRFTADLRCDRAATAYNLIDALAQAVPRAGRSGRTLDQLRADTFADLMTTLAETGYLDLRADPAEPSATDHALSGNRPRGSGLSVHLDVTVSVSTLAGLDNQPADLAGHGVITAELARTLARAARTVRLISTRCGSTPVAGQYIPDVPEGNRDSSALPCHDGCGGTYACGTDLDYGRTVYRPPAALNELVRARDRCCRFPGCALPARRCDLDHRRPYDDGGATCACNLDALCRFHHRCKTFIGWHARRDQNTLIWTSPLGREYVDLSAALPHTGPLGPEHRDLPAELPHTSPLGPEGVNPEPALLDADAIDVNEGQPDRSARPDRARRPWPATPQLPVEPPF